jgi:hypothetical protein
MSFALQYPKNFFMSTTFITIAIAYVCISAIVLRTFHFLKDKDEEFLK